MFTKFLLLEWKSAKRSSIWQKNLALNLVIGFFLFLALLYLLLIGVFIGEILQKVYPGEDPVIIFNGFLIFYFFIDLFIRFMMQSLPAISLESFLHLPIRRSSIIHYMVGRTILNFFNLMPLFIFIPVLFTLIVPEAGSLQALYWLVSLLLLILGNTFLATYIKRMFGTKPLFVLALVLIIGALFTMDKTGVFSFSQLSSQAFGTIILHPLYLFIPLVWMIAMYSLHYQFLKAHLYPEEVMIKKHREVHSSAGGKLLRSFGVTGTIIMLEMKLYWRHKRTRTMIYMLPLFLGYGLFFYFQPEYREQDFMVLFIGVFMTGGMMLNYTNYAFGYESNYFDALLTKNIDFQQYIWVKFLIAISISTICWVLTIPYLFFGSHILFVNTAMFLYNIGILSYILLYFAKFNKKRMDLSKGAAFNYQGIGAMNWLAIIPAFLLPVLIQIPFKQLGIPNIGLVVVACIGIFGLIMHKPLLKLIQTNLSSRKYIMASAFRERS
ncbi:MAG: hypothetical protein HQ542_12335 [Bacteroidia bacterium]|nr:hypothetical protein [Bacteroidia bacterium]